MASNRFLYALFLIYCLDGCVFAAAVGTSGDPSADLGHLLDLFCASGSPSGPGCTFQTGFAFRAVSQSRADNQTSWGFTLKSQGTSRLTYGFQEEVPEHILVQLKTFAQPQGEFLGNLELDPQSMVGAQIVEPSGMYTTPEIHFLVAADPTSRLPAMSPGARAMGVFPRLWDDSFQPPRSIPQNVAY